MQGVSGIRVIAIIFFITGRTVLCTFHSGNPAAGSLLSGQDLPPGTFTISGTIENTVQGMIYLAGFYGDRFILRDSIGSSSGAFYFLLNEMDPPGVYRILFNQVSGSLLTENRFIEFIFNREDVEIFQASAGDGVVPAFDNSAENTVYSEFLAFEIGYEEKIMELYGRLHTKTAARQYDVLQIRRQAYIDSIAALHPDLYATRIIRAFRSPMVPGSMSHRERIDTLRICFFNYAAIDDPALMYAPVYTFRILDFLSLFRKEGLAREEQENLFMEAVDRIMVNTSTDRELRSFVVDFLLEGFRMLGMEQVQVHLAESYQDETCPSDTGSVVHARMECYLKMGPGEKAPDFVIRDIKGVNYQLSALDQARVVVIFWSSECEHCRKLLPELNDWYLQENGADLEVLAISIDTSEASFREYIRELKPQWITARDPLGWMGKVPTDYCIYATPSMFLLDNGRTILAKPVSFRQILRELRRVD